MIEQVLAFDSEGIGKGGTTSGEKAICSQERGGDARYRNEGIDGQRKGDGAVRQEGGWRLDGKGEAECDCR